MTLLIFDIDGTLVYSERRDSACFAAAYQKIYGKPFPSIDWSTYPHVTDTTIFRTVIERHFGRLPDEDERLAFQKCYLALLAEKRRLDPGHSKEVPGARKALDRLLTDDRYAVGVATGGWREPAHLKLGHVGITAESFPLEGADGRTSREEIIRALVEAAARQFGKMNRIVYLGDAEWDVHTTRNLQMDFIGVRWRNDRQVLQRAGATQVITDYLDFEGFMEAVRAASPPLLPSGTNH